MTAKSMIGFGWLINANEFKSLFPNYEDHRSFFEHCAWTEEIFFGQEIVTLGGGNPVNISEVIIDYLDKAEETANDFALILRHNGITWDENDKWNTLQVYYLEVLQ